MRRGLQLAGLLLTATIGGVGQESLEYPIALAISGTGVLERSGTELPISLLAGDLLYSGDRVSTQQDEITLLFCPSSSEITMPAGSSISLDSQGVQVEGKSISENPVVFCRLPRTPKAQLAKASFVGASITRTRELVQEETVDPEDEWVRLPPERREQFKSELGRIESQITKDPENPSLKLARAVLFHDYGLLRTAATQYRRLNETWQGVGWPRKLSHVLQEERRRAIPASSDEFVEGDTFALLVGISRYPRLRLEEQLEFADDDAETLARFLSSPAGGGLPEDNIRVIVNEAATTGNIRNSIATFLRAKAKPHDTVIVFMAAHGVSDDREGYIVTFDSDPEDLRNTAIPMSEISGLLQDEFAHVGKVLMFVDVCRAGTIGLIPKRNNINQIVDVMLRLDGAETLGLLGSGPGEYSFESDRFGGGHGAFSYFLLRGMNGAADGNDDGEIDSGELIQYVRTRVREATLQQQTPRETGNMRSAVVLVEDVDLDGIELNDWKPLERKTARTRHIRRLESPPASTRSGRRRQARIDRDLEQFEVALEEGRILPERAGSAFGPLELLKRRLRNSLPEYLELENRLRVSLQDRGQGVLLHYLRGEEVLQTRSAFQSGELFFRAATQLDPDASALESRAVFCRGRMLVFEQRYEEAIAELERAVRLDPNGAYTYNALGIAYLEMGSFPPARQAFRDAVRLAPTWIYPRHNLALTNAQLGDYQLAEVAYRQALELAPQSYSLNYNLGLLHERLDRRPEARECFRAAIQLNPDRPEAHNALGVLYADWGKRRRAEQEYRKSVEVSEDFIPARHNLGVLLARDRSRREEAVSLWKEILSKRPDFLPARMSLAETLTESGAVTEAIREFELVLKDSPSVTSARLALSELYIENDQPDEAIAVLEHALDANGTNRVVLERIGDAYLAGGNSADARTYYKKILELQPDPQTAKRLGRKLRRLPVS